MERQELEKLTRDYQLIQEQLQALAMQKEQFTIQREEQKEATKELEKAEGKIYVGVGGVIVETSKTEAMKRSKDQQESVDMRLTIINKQYDEFSKKEKSLREEITEAFKTQKA